MRITFPSEEYALAIRALGHQQHAPVVYDLNSPVIDIGSADDNHIVLNGAGVEPYHLAVRQVGPELCLVVDKAIVERHGESAWPEGHSDEHLFCPQHGQIRQAAGADGCPLCHESGRTVWLMRPLQAGDVFPIGQSFEASVLSQRKPNPSAENGTLPTGAPWPDPAWLENPPRPLAVLDGDQNAPLVERAYPLEDSNLWLWSHEDAPLPIFMHQRVNRHVTRHAGDNRMREVGGILLGQIYRAPDDECVYPVITHAIAARFATEARGHLTFTPETWLDINQQREEHHPGKRIVGWYHTHPGLDIFLSEWDLFIHRNFFRQPWQVALVVDPHIDSGGFFVWDGDDVLQPQRPLQLFTTADLDDGLPGAQRTRVRIKLGEPVR